MKRYRYYMPMRPPMPGALPMPGLIETRDYGTKKMAETIGTKAWGHADYDRPLTATEAYSYELITGEVIDDGR